MGMHMAIQVGAENCLKPIDSGVWISAMMNHAHPPPPMTDDDFYTECFELAQNRFGIDFERDISSTNCILVYKYLVDNI